VTRISQRGCLVFISPLARVSAHTPTIYRKPYLGLGAFGTNP